MRGTITERLSTTLSSPISFSQGPQEATPPNLRHRRIHFLFDGSPPARGTLRWPSQKATAVPRNSLRVRTGTKKRSEGTAHAWFAFLGGNIGSEPIRAWSA